MNRIRVAVVEDDPNWQKSIVSYLRKHEGINVIGTAASRQESIELAKSQEIDIMLMDINLSGNECDGIYAVLDILAVKDIKIMMLTSLNNENLIKDSFTAGAMNYISKENYQDIPFYIKKCHEENFPLEVLIKEFGRLKREEQLKDLSRSEKEIFDLMDKGYNHAQIERKLFKTHNTLKAQIKSMLKKFKVKSCKEALMKVNSRGLKTSV